VTKAICGGGGLPEVIILCIPNRADVTIKEIRHQEDKTALAVKPSLPFDFSIPKYIIHKAIAHIKYHK
jgi:hypothetical protein